MNKNKFIFAAYLAPPPALKENNFNEKIMEDGYRLLSDSGFNFAYGFYEKAPSDIKEVQRALVLAEKYNIEYLVQDSNISKKNFSKTDFLKSSGQYSNYKAFSGNFIFDEPSSLQIPILKEMKEFYSSIFPNKIAYVNLQPIDSPAHYLVNGMWTEFADVKKIDYYDYLSIYFEQIKPSFLSFDYYPFTQNENEVKSEYFEQLNVIRMFCDKNNLPFWAYIQSCMWDNSVSRIPNTNEMYFNINTSIAFGAVGLQYFCFFTPYSSINKSAAIISCSGEKTERYFAVKECHTFLKNIENKICGRKNNGVLFYGKSPCAIPKTNSKCDRITSLNGNCIIGIFEEKYLFVVSSSIEHNLKKIEINFVNDTNFNIYRQNGLCFSGRNLLSIDIEGGEAFLIEFK